MTITDALDIVVARTKHERFRQLCDPNDPAYSPGYIDVVMSMATGEPMPTPEPAPSPITPEYRRGKPVVSKGCGPCHSKKDQDA